jgi:peptidylprolyl isomerase
MQFRVLLLSVLTVLIASCAQSQTNPKVIIHTSMGDMTVMLYNETPKHRDNFLKLAKEHYYDGVLFHRVIEGFMIQGGDPFSKSATPGQRLGKGEPSYKLPAEIVFPQYYHKYGALAAARQGDQTNPQKESSGSQFFIVQGQQASDGDLSAMQEHITQSRKQQAGYKAIAPYKDSLSYYSQVRDSARFVNLRQRAIAAAEKAAEAEPSFVIPDNIKQAYTTRGGVPSLDGEYTVFGEVVEGLDVIDKIAAVKRDANDRPLEDVKMWMEVVE